MKKKKGTHRDDLNATGAHIEHIINYFTTPLFSIIKMCLID